MNNNKNFIAALIAAGLMWAPAAALAQKVEADVDVQTDRDKEPVLGTELDEQPREERLEEPQQDREGQVNREGQVTAANKAGDLIGMEVKTDQGVEVGSIEEIVLDVPQGRIAYFVMSAGGFLGFGERWIAVPPNAVKPSPGNDYLILSTDDKNVLGAAGFPKTNWPRVDQPRAWGAEAPESLDDSHDSSERIDIQTDADRPARGETDAQQRDARLQSEVRIDDDRDARTETFSGRVAAINPESRSMTVVSDGNRLEFEVSDQARITLERAGQSRLTDVRIGQEVEVTYVKNQNGDMVVQQITRKNSL